MTNKSFFLLAIVLLILVGLCVKTVRKPEPVNTEAVSAGDSLLGSFDINAVAGIKIVDVNGTAVVTRADGKWVVPGLWKYPANFDQVADSLRMLSEMKIGQIIRGGEKYPEDFGLASSDTNAPAVVFRRIQLLDDQGSVIRDLQVGKPYSPGDAAGMRWGVNGRYYRLEQGPVVLCKETLDDLGSQGNQWVKRDLLNLSPSEIKKINIQNGTEAIQLTVQSSGGVEIDRLSENEEVVAERAQRNVNVLAYLTFEDVADPSMSLEELGFTNAVSYEARTEKGLIYTLKFGHADSRNRGRYAKVSVQFEKPPPPEIPVGAATDTNITAVAEAQMKAYEASVQQSTQEAGELTDRLQPWTYVIANNFVEDLLMPRSSLVKTRGSQSVESPYPSSMSIPEAQ